MRKKITANDKGRAYDKLRDRPAVPPVTTWECRKIRTPILASVHPRIIHKTFRINKLLCLFFSEFSFPIIYFNDRILNKENTCISEGNNTCSVINLNEDFIYYIHFERKGLYGSNRCTIIIYFTKRWAYDD